jgi:RHH-type transcriptional regulator, proline utilization regulon repressor / proline dehydrogenase / delta 1-pyrroline-5-carboxylate dehydrogenase
MDFTAPPLHSRLPSPYRYEKEVIAGVLESANNALHWPDVMIQAKPWVEAVRRNPAPFWAMESLLQEYPISSAEGLALMRLAEALLRVPDMETAVALTADQLGKADFDSATAIGPHKILAGLSASAIALSKKFLPKGPGDSGLITRLGSKTVVTATLRAIQLLGQQFVLGRDIGEAMHKANAARKTQPRLSFSYDMLGEGARTDQDALRYLEAYQNAIQSLAQVKSAVTPEQADGISIKLSALCARYEEPQRDQVFEVLLPRVWQLIETAAKANINLTIDAEESERLELSLDVLDALAQKIAVFFPHWRGFGLAIQSYQTRALQVVDEVAKIARSHQLHCMVRLVKGAYWDSEIKRAQEMGLEHYPVFTHKNHTDISYLACAHALISHSDCIYPQFATHNAGTIAAICQMTKNKQVPFELQRLHGMGEGIYREVLHNPSLNVRVYAPVGQHRDLLAYLVRRLLENGANSSFVHQLVDPQVEAHQLLASPLVLHNTGSLPLPGALYGWKDQQGRKNSTGLDMTYLAHRKFVQQAVNQTRLSNVPMTQAGDVNSVMQGLDRGFATWNAMPVAHRATILCHAADRLEEQMPEFCGLLVKEAHKTLGDAVAEVREAVDFLRYYADQAQSRLQTLTLPGPTGESNQLHLHGRGVFVCISPWNFPLAIFMGQVAAALVTGNTVAAKPAEQTPLVAKQAVQLLHEAGVPSDALAWLHGRGETVGAALVAHPVCAGVCFTGSTSVAKIINRTLAAKEGPIVPLIAETGGINAMIVDSSALPEQVVDAVVQSAFRSAGQRCSALRLLCVHDSIADALIEMIEGALQQLVLGNAQVWKTDVGPLIDAQAVELVQQQVNRLRQEAKLIGQSPMPPGAAQIPNLLAPVAFEVKKIADVKTEIFAPVLHLVRWSGAVEDVIQQINSLGYGLTLGIQTRIDSRALQLAALARVGNVYINRNMIGAVVGVQPFGGEGFSGTGPKAGGPHYLYRFCVEQTVTINTAAAGGNAALLSG